MKKYVKFTEGCNPHLLTPNKPYEVLSSPKHRSTMSIKNDCGHTAYIASPSAKFKCAHINGQWQWCDENGKEVISE